MVTKQFKCNSCAENAIIWLEKNKHLINDGGLSNEIIITVVDDKALPEED